MILNVHTYILNTQAHTCTDIYIYTKLVNDRHNDVSFLHFSQVGRLLVARRMIWFLALEIMGKCLGKRHTRNTPT